MRQTSPTRRTRIVYWSSLGVCLLLWLGAGIPSLTTVKVFTDPSMSMANTVLPGDRVLAVPAGQLRRGDVIVAAEPSVGPGLYIRRVIGLPGDRVTCCDARGRITVNGKALTETYVHPGDAPAKIRFNVVVPTGKLWLMGDNRAVANDSSRLGPLAVRQVRRVIATLAYPDLTLLRTPPTFVAAGLAPPDNRQNPVLISLYISGPAFLVGLVLSIYGLTRHLLRRRRRRALARQAAVVG